MPQNSNKVLIAGSIFAEFGAAHLIDDFLFGVPAEFNLANEIAHWLGPAFFAALAGLIALAGRGSHQSYYGLALIGLLLALADSLAHLPKVLSPGVFRSGFSSVLFSLGLIASGIFLAYISILALKRS